MYKLKDKEQIFIYTGPDGSGRKTLGKMVATTFDMETVVSFTTRPPKNYEKNGDDYHFINEETFLQMEEQQEFLESVKIDGYYYGIRELDVEKCFQKHKILYLALNAEGAQKIKQIYKDRVIRIFVYADRETVIQRQKERGDDDASIERHMLHYDEIMNEKDTCEHSFENYDLPQVSFQISEMIETYLDRHFVVDEY